MSTLFIRVAAALCFLAVALGAFGAHSLRSTLETHSMLDVWNKAVLYHFIHAIALFVLALYGAANRGAWWLLFAGIFLFSGSLYLMALTNLRWLGPVTPLGGLCFLAGWRGLSSRRDCRGAYVAQVDRLFRWAIDVGPSAHGDTRLYKLKTDASRRHAPV
jgi:uncharacterized membrane protein YgdD (TMEM256/DUF423 family)